MRFVFTQNNKPSRYNSITEANNFDVKVFEKPAFTHAQLNMVISNVQVFTLPHARGFMALINPNRAYE